MSTTIGAIVVPARWADGKMTACRPMSPCCAGSMSAAATGSPWPTCVRLCWGWATPRWRPTFRAATWSSPARKPTPRRSPRRSSAPSPSTWACGPESSFLPARSWPRWFADNPFPDEPNPRWVHAIFRNGPLAPDELAAVAAAQQRAQDQGSEDEARVVGTTLFLHAPAASAAASWQPSRPRLGGDHPLRVMPAHPRPVQSRSRGQPQRTPSWPNDSCWETADRWPRAGRSNGGSRWQPSNRMSCWSWPTTSAGSTLAPTTAASWALRRPTSTGSPPRAPLTDNYAQASCTAGRAAFITGQIPMRTGLTTVGLPGAPQGIQPEDPTTPGTARRQPPGNGRNGAPDRRPAPRKLATVDARG
jgi:hypothetical protein